MLAKGVPLEDVDKAIAADVESACQGSDHDISDAQAPNQHQLKRPQRSAPKQQPKQMPKQQLQKLLTIVTQLYGEGQLNKLTSLRLTNSRTKPVPPEVVTLSEVKLLTHKLLQI